MAESEDKRRWSFRVFRKQSWRFNPVRVALIGGIGLVLVGVARMLTGVIVPNSPFWGVGLLLLMTCWTSHEPKHRGEKLVDDVARWKGKRRRLASLALLFGFLGLMIAAHSWYAFRRACLCRMSPYPIADQTLGGTYRNLLDGYAFAVLALVCFAVAFGLVRSESRAKHQLRRAEGKCVKCGYLLTGLTEPRCPECGTGFELPAGTGDG